MIHGLDFYKDEALVEIVLWGLALAVVDENSVEDFDYINTRLDCLELR
jgi:hypothetical protein